MRHKPDIVYLAAATAGGIHANSQWPASFIYDNLAIELSVIEAARLAGTEKLLFVGSSAMYPRLAPQPLLEDYLLTGALEPTTQWYAVAKIAGLKLCEAYRKQYGSDFISAVAPNLYGLGDKFGLTSSHVISALIERIHLAHVTGSGEVGIWGTGKARREFLFVDDMADACVFLMQHYSSGAIINVGTGEDVSIVDLASQIALIVGFKGRFVFDTSKPDGMPRKVMDVRSLSALGWRAPVGLAEGLRRTYAWYLETVDAGRIPSKATSRDHAGAVVQYPR
jgi:GDP-L-fucose synthase